MRLFARKINVRVDRVRGITSNSRRTQQVEKRLSALRSNDVLGWPLQEFGDLQRHESECDHAEKIYGCKCCEE